MFKKRNISGTLCSKSKLFYCLLFLKISNFFLKVEHDGDTSNFDFFPEDDAPEPEDDLTGWDKDF